MAPKPTVRSVASGKVPKTKSSIPPRRISQTVRGRALNTARALRKR